MRRFASVKTIVNYKLLAYEEDLPIYSYDFVSPAPGHGATTIATRERYLWPDGSSSLRSVYP